MGGIVALSGAAGVMPSTTPSKKASFLYFYLKGGEDNGLLTFRALSF